VTGLAGHLGLVAAIAYATEAVRTGYAGLDRSTAKTVRLLAAGSMAALVGTLLLGRDLVLYTAFWQRLNLVALGVAATLAIGAAWTVRGLGSEGRRRTPSAATDRVDSAPTHWLTRSADHSGENQPETGTTPRPTATPARGGKVEISSRSPTGMSYRTETDISRRTYLKLTGGASAVGLTGVAGCLGDGDSTTITPGTAPGFPPFEMQEDGELVGFDIDLLEAVVDETEYELGEWATFEFDSLIPALTQNEEIDVIAAAMTITEDRQETIAFSDPYWESDQAILVREGGDFQPSAWEDFEGVSVGAQSGTTGADQVQSNLVDPGLVAEDDYRTYGSYVLAVEDLENENIDAVVIDPPVAETFAANRDVEIAFIEETGEQFGFGLRQGESEFQSALNDGLATVRDDGTYSEITNTWFGQE